MALYTPVVYGSVGTIISLGVGAYQAINNFMDGRAAEDQAAFDAEATKQAAARDTASAINAAAAADAKRSADAEKAKQFMGQWLPVVGIVGVAAVAGIILGGKRKR